MENSILPTLSLITAVAVPTIALVIAVARGFARMEVRFTEIKGIISQHAVDLLRVEGDLRADLIEIRMALSEGIKDHENRLRDLERHVFRSEKLAKYLITHARRSTSYAPRYPSWTRASWRNKPRSMSCSPRSARA